jgi:hypothetical protein
LRETAPSNLESLVSRKGAKAQRSQRKNDR